LVSVLTHSPDLLVTEQRFLMEVAEPVEVRLFLAGSHSR
jgi:hypothetical protein